MRIGTLALLSILGTASGAQAQELVAVEDREARLDAWLTSWGQSAESQRVWSGAIGVGGGVAIAGVGVWQVWESQPGVEGAWAAVLALAALDVAIGITRLLVPSVPELRLGRWRAARRDGPLDGEELAAFEGEIRAEAHSAAQTRQVLIGLGLGLIATGALGFGLTAGLGTDELAWALGYTGSGLGVLIGGVLALVSIFDTPLEQEWDAYERGFAPRALSVTPLVGPSLVGLGANGSF